MKKWLFGFLALFTCLSVFWACKDDLAPVVGSVTPYPNVCLSGCTNSVTGNLPLANVTTGSAGQALTMGASAAQWSVKSNGVNNFRCSLSSTLPVTSTDVTAATSIYLVPYNGDRISLYTSGANWHEISSSSTITLAIGTISASVPEDVYAYDNSGSIALEQDAWGSSTARTSGDAGTAIGTQDGVTVKGSDSSRRLVCTYYPTTTTTTEDSHTNRYLFNEVNRVFRHMYQTGEESSAASWTYNSTTIRAADGHATNALNFVLGDTQLLTARVQQACSSANTYAAANVWLAFNSTTTNNASITSAGSCAFSSTLAFAVPLDSNYLGYPAIGANILNWNESTGSGTTPSYTMYPIGIWATLWN